MDKNKESGTSPRYSDGISFFGTIAAVIGGLFLAAGAAALFGGGEDIPVILTVILWIR